MGRTTFTSDNKSRSNSQFPKFKLEFNEVARIILIEPEAWREFIHELKMPAVADGKAVYVTKTRKDGSEYEEQQMDFVGRYICLGDESVVEEEGADPENCPMCEASVENGGKINPPTPRYAAQLLRYGTKQGSVEIRKPFTTELFVWSFTPRINDRLIDLAEKWKSLQDHDLELGPCKSAEYQNFDISVLPDAGWQESDETRKLALETLKENKVSEEVLRAACGRVGQKSFIVADIAKVLERWRVVDNPAPVNLTQSSPTVSSAEKLDTGLAGLLDEDVSLGEDKAPAFSKPNSGEDELDVADLLDEI